MNKKDIIVGKTYRHIESKKCYVVVNIANEHSDKKWPIMIVYIDDDGKVWARTLNEFCLKFEVRK